MCFAPQRRALFRHRWPSERPKVVRTWCVLYIFTSKCASRHNGVHFFDIATSKSGPNMVCFVHFLLRNVLRATTACTFSTSQLPKVVRDHGVLPLFTSKCASRHNGVHFFHIATSKSRPNLTCFATFYFQMCFAPQRRALFPHRNFQKWSGPDVFCTFYFQMCFAPQRRALFPHLNFQKCSEHGVFCHFLLQNVLRATTACNFSSLICPDVSAPAALASLLFDPPEPQNTGKTQCFATFLPFRAPASSLFWLSPSLIFSLLTFYTSEFLPGSASSWLCCFSSVQKYVVFCCSHSTH